MKRAKLSFYDQYHKENRNKPYTKKLKENNFTYFLILKNLKRAINLIQGEKRTALDLGCGVGVLSFFLYDRGFSVTGIDISKDAIDICLSFKKKSQIEKGIEFIQGDIEKINSNSKFDLVVCSEVIEHVNNDDELLRKISQKLNSKGILFLSTPSNNAPLYRLGLLNDFDKRVGHLRRYDLKNLIEIIEKNDLEIVFSDKTEGVFRNLLFTIKPLGYLIKLIKGPLVEVFHFFDMISVKLFGESDLIIIARKK